MSIQHERFVSSLALTDLFNGLGGLNPTLSNFVYRVPRRLAANDLAASPQPASWRTLQRPDTSVCLTPRNPRRFKRRNNNEKQEQSSNDLARLQQSATQKHLIMNPAGMCCLDMDQDRAAVLRQLLWLQPGRMKSSVLLCTNQIARAHVE